MMNRNTRDVLQDDGQVYACGQEGTFVKVTVVEG